VGGPSRRPAADLSQWQRCACQLCRPSVLDKHYYLDECHNYFRFVCLVSPIESLDDHVILSRDVIILSDHQEINYYYRNNNINYIIIMLIIN